MQMDLAIFAHNEADGIAAVIAQLGQQDVFAAPGLDLRVLVLANGCCDATVPKARDAIAALPAPLHAIFSVIDLPEGGKSRTGHRFIHDIARPKADLLGFMDTDIELPRQRHLNRRFLHPH